MVSLISQKLYRAAILSWVDQKASNFQQIFFFENSVQNTILPSLLLFLCTCYYFDLDHIQWTEVAISTARNFNSNWRIYLNFWNIWFIKNCKCQQFVFWKRSRQKTLIFHFSKGPLFRNECPYWYEFWRILRDSCGLLKSVILQLFPKYNQSNVSLNVKSRAKFNRL